MEQALSSAEHKSSCPSSSLKIHNSRPLKTTLRQMRPIGSPSADWFKTQYAVHHKGNWEWHCAKPNIAVPSQKETVIFIIIIIIIIIITICLATISTASSKAVLHTVRFSVSSFNFHYLFVALSSSRSCLPFLPRHSKPLIFLSVTCLRRQFLRKMHQSSPPSFVLLYAGSSFPSWLFIILIHFYPLIPPDHHPSPVPHYIYSSYFWATFRSVYIITPYQTMSQL